MSNVMFDDLPVLEDVEGNSFYFLDYIKPNKLKVWEKELPKNGEYTSICRLIDIASIGVDELAKLNILKEMPIEIQEEMKTKEELENIQVHSLMKKARGSRRQKYPNIPKKITCTECGETIDVIPSTVAYKINKKNIMLVDYIASYKCPECNKRIGWVRNNNKKVL